jgi:hypothetical protein
MRACHPAFIDGIRAGFQPKLNPNRFCKRVLQEAVNPDGFDLLEHCAPVALLLWCE